MKIDRVKGIANGVVKTPASMAIEVIRNLVRAIQVEKIDRVTVTVNEDVATYLNNKKRRELSRLEEEATVAWAASRKPRT